MKFLAVIWIIATFNTNVLIEARDGRIIGGTRTSIEKHPYQVSLRQGNSHFCGGSIITQRHVLTAAHCLYWFSPTAVKNFRVYIGSSLSYKGIHCAVENYKMHPQYDDRNLIHDIAVVKLSEPMRFNRYAMPIELASQPPRIGSIAVVTGWGLTEQKTTSDPALVLQMARMRIISLEECRRSFAIQTETLLCAVLKKGVGTCNGDSGGPLVVNRELVGVVSFGSIKCADGHPDAYTSVYHYLDFINQTIAPETLPRESMPVHPTLYSRASALNSWWNVWRAIIASMPTFFIAATIVL